jgi:hypothetical protein
MLMVMLMVRILRLVVRRFRWRRVMHGRGGSRVTPGFDSRMHSFRSVYESGSIVGGDGMGVSEMKGRVNEGIINPHQDHHHHC